MQKKIIVIALIILMGAGFIAYRKHASTTAPTLSSASSYTQDPGTAVSIMGTAASSSLATESWNVFQAYMNAVKNHDLEALSGSSYKLSDACLDSTQLPTCTSRMDAVYGIIKNFKKSDFTNVVYDDRQIILTTDWHLETSDVAIGEARQAIYFVRTTTGAPKVLYFTQPEEIVYSFKDATMATSTLIDRLKVRITDSDQDALENEVETCTYEGAASSTPPCVQTDPNKKDTNGNGWWDSIDAHLK
ncbi:MAG: hypothetical protein JWN50_184 [Parcubacteria group bacterium]|nr:hypothetical protein [Parcubacteria group bacterium]